MSDPRHVKLYEKMVEQKTEIDRLRNELKAEQARCEHFYIQVEFLTAKISEFNDTYQRIMSEDCATDEKHCTCVPHLKSRLAKQVEASRDYRHGAEIGLSTQAAMLEEVERERDEARGEAKQNSSHYGVLEQTILRLREEVHYWEFMDSSHEELVVLKSRLSDAMEVVEAAFEFAAGFGEVASRVNISNLRTALAKLGGKGE